MKVTCMKILLLLMYMYYLQAVDNTGQCKQSEVVVGRLGKNLSWKFPSYDWTVEFNKKIFENNIKLEDLHKLYKVVFKKMNSTDERIIFKDGKSTNGLDGDQTEVFVDHYSLMFNIKKLRIEDVGVYKIYFNSHYLGQSTVIVIGKPILKGRSPPNPVLLADDNPTTNIQLECPSVSTSIGDCQLKMNIVWYNNNNKTFIGSEQTQIYVTVDQNGGNFMGLATEYQQCYERIKMSNDVLNIKECNNVYEKETFIVQPEYGPIDVKLEPDQREITVNINEDLKVRCSAKCNPQCDIKWTKEGFVNIKFDKDLKIDKISSIHEGVYVCQVNNTHGVDQKNFSVIGKKEPKAKDLNAGAIVGIVIGVIVVAAVAAGIAVICYNKSIEENQESCGS